LVKLFPAQAIPLDQKRTASLAPILSREGAEAVNLGVAWGQAVADAILAWRSTDGFSTVLPPFVGGTAPGQWRPTPPGFAAGLAPQMAQMTPFAIASPSQFRPPSPPSLASARYTADFEEVKTGGSAASTTRTADQTLFARFWQSGSPADIWGQVATSLTASRHRRLIENARLFALLNMSMADAVIGCWDAKYYYDTWRPITAINLASTDGNPATSEDGAWMPLIATPPFPEYPAGHACASGAAAAVLAARFGEHTAFGAVSDGMPGTTRYFTSFSAALEEVKSARVYGGFHFRTACEIGQTLGERVARYIGRHSMRPLDDDEGEDH
jgi:hypothetical protein